MGIIWVMTRLDILVSSVSSAVLDTLTTVLMYSFTLLIVIGVPVLLRKARTTYQELGLTRWPSWFDLMMVPLGFFVYFILTWIFGVVGDAVIPWYDLTVTQDIGFQGLSQRYEVVLAFVCLVVLAPLAEELLFRGYLFGKLSKHAPMWAAAIITSVLFGVLHGSWVVGIDVFALSLVLCTLRVITGSIWSPVVLHMVKNGVAFYFLFINPF